MSGLDLFGAVSTADTGERSAKDFYETPAYMVRSLILHHPPIVGAYVLEPASGRDAIARVLREEAGCRVITNDLDPAHPSQWHFDATAGHLWSRVGPDVKQDGRSVEWVIGNFTFDVAFAIAIRAFAVVPNMALLLRKTFLEPTVERGEWLNRFPPTRIIGLPRHKFRGESSDSVSADWHIWQRRPDPMLPAIVIDHLAKTRTRRLL